MPKAKKEVKEKKEGEVKKEAKAKQSVVANVFAILAVIFLALNGILVLLLKNWLIEQLKLNVQEIIFTPSLFIKLGLLWLVLALLIFFSNFNIRKNKKEWRWFMLILSIITIFSGRLESGLFAIIASIIYLAKWQKE